MKENQLKSLVFNNEIKSNKREKGTKDDDNSDESQNYIDELQKYKQSFYIIKKTISLLKNYYNNKINKTESLRVSEKKKLFYLKKKSVILEDKCTFYSEHVGELNKIYIDQINNKNKKIQNLQYELEQMNKDEVESETSNNILKLREDQIERLSQQLDSINNLYHKQVDVNKNLISEIEDLNKNIHYLNNKIQDEKNNRNILRKRFKYYKKYNKNKKGFKFNPNIFNEEEYKKEKINQNEDICFSILCFLKTELDLIDDKKKIYIKEKESKNNNFFKKIINSNYKRKKKESIFETIYKKQFFSLYENRFIEDDIKFEKKNIFSMFLKHAKKSDKNNGDSNINDNNKKNYEIKKRSNNIVNKNKKNTNDKGENIKKSNNIPEGAENNNSKWNYLTLNNIYFYNNPTDNFDDKNKENIKQNGNENKFYKSYSLNDNQENVEPYNLKTTTHTKQGGNNKRNNRTNNKRNTLNLNNLDNYKDNDSIEEVKFEKKNNEVEEIYSDNF
ncbi:conserved Plasmodium protein, unknown function [Plasmodium berghei]|uniref:Uncharacterized protein n=2 Tax=Plasmodium berghei TaxID=5821 RepID=A0A509AWC4_PLABA|nr:conserved Plasmodium protein, unknown function [Plasmodium berghei ANKA]CXJ28226.1 conserved Plasmodium protein, unknown function [Plasmodium berghei]SCM27042.1 conserved Plasmodium protein, unknown function [Plasmodium berghei]SCN28768.1 conserved Plasmodium protein, unknown function [Plasmodium berghei]SCO63043.1 conserved Plasmodium protein, unknown function [Plasmodium berghei]SCO64515.1 conserved Plasmodium protein, unknown function [Plasmodium berghei]|eukprot:XP_034424414.1 conserved Plasmodium protein, unknown function [Plasmodium berghei ANKA]